MTLAAEFPNDNPDLHEGAIWVCLDVTGLPVAERRVRSVVLEAVAVAPPVQVVEEPATVIEAVETIETIAAVVEEATPPPVRESGIFMVETFSSLADDGDDEEEDEILVEELGPLEDAILEEVVAEELILEAAAIAEAAPIVEPEPVIEPVAPVEMIAEPAPVVTIAPPPPDDSFVVFVSTMVDIAVSHGASAAASELPAMLAADAIGQAWAGILRGTSEDWDAVGGSNLDEWAADTLARATGVDAPTLKRDLRARGIAAFGLAA